MRYNGFWVLAALSVILFFSPIVHAIPVDLSTFDLRDDTVTIFGPDNSSAEFTEYWGPDTLLDYDLPIPADALSLSFNYELLVAPYNEDHFDFYFGDLSYPSDISIGGYNSNPTESLVYAGTVSKNLTDFAGNILPIAFTLNYGFDDGYTYDVLDATGSPAYIGNEYASILTISNVEINPVPEPATLLLLGSGILGMIGFRKRRISGAA